MPPGPTPTAPTPGAAALVETACPVDALDARQGLTLTDTRSFTTREVEADAMFIVNGRMVHEHLGTV